MALKDTILRSEEEHKNKRYNAFIYGKVSVKLINIFMKKILIYNSGGGLGDSIQLFSLILSLKNHFKSTEFYYLGAHENHFQGKLKLLRLISKH